MLIDDNNNNKLKTVSPNGNKSDELPLLDSDLICTM